MSTLKIVQEALDFEQNYKQYKTRSEKIEASRKVKEIILSINSIYKLNDDTALMDIMKRLTVVKKKLEKRLKGRL